MTNAYSKTGQMAFCCQNLTQGSRSALAMVVGALFKKFGLFLNTHRTLYKSVIFFFAVNLNLINFSFRIFPLYVPEMPTRFKPYVVHIVCISFVWLL
jgi:hypothetical protein